MTGIGFSCGFQAWLDGEPMFVASESRRLRSIHRNHAAGDCSVPDLITRATTPGAPPP